MPWSVLRRSDGPEPGGGTGDVEAEASIPVATERRSSPAVATPRHASRTGRPRRRLLGGMTGRLAPGLAAGVLCVTTLMAGCGDWAPQTGVQQLEQELSTTCRALEGGTTRVTEDPASSTQPSIAPYRDGFVVAWVDDRVLPPGLYIQRLDELGSPRGHAQRIVTSGEPSRPRIAQGDRGLLVLFSEETDRGEVARLQVLDSELRPQLTRPPTLVESLPHGRKPGLAAAAGHYVAALGGESGLRLWDIRVQWLDEGSAGDSGTPPTDHDGGSSRGAGDAGLVDDASVERDGGAAQPNDGCRIEIQEREVPYGENVEPPALLDLVSWNGRLYYAADHLDGWSIQVAEVGEDRVRRVAQIIDDRRHPQLRHRWPALAPTGQGHLAVMWQGPSVGLTAIHLIEIDSDGRPVGRDRPFEAIVRDDDERVLGRAPAFHPAVTSAPGGIVAVFADNRYANSEILSVAFGCGEAAR